MANISPQLRCDITSAQLIYHCAATQRSGGDLLYSIAICDDERSFCESTSKILMDIFERQQEQVGIDCFESLYQLELNEKSYDLIILDIMLGEENGIEYARQLRSRGIDTDIIFITSSPEYALAGYSAYPVDYILKPVDPKKLGETIRRCLKSRKSLPPLVLSSKESGQIKLRLEEVSFCEVIRTDIMLHLSDGRRFTTVGTFSAFCRELPKSLFFRCHRSYVVNMSYVERIDRYSFTLSDGSAVPIAKNSYNDAKKAFVDYINPAEDFI